MSIAKNITIWCDNIKNDDNGDEYICSILETFDTPKIKTARKIAKCRGWIYMCGKDYCPSCAYDIGK